jgi:hypothetical protein
MRAGNTGINVTTETYTHVSFLAIPLTGEKLTDEGNSRPIPRYSIYEP